MNPQKIVLTGTLRGKGGIQTHLKYFSKAFSNERYTVLIISMIPITDNDKRELSIFQNDNVQLIYDLDDHPTNNIITRLKYLMKLIKTVRGFSPDIYIATGTSLNASLLSLFLGIRVKKVFYEVMTGKYNRMGFSMLIIKLWFNELIGISPIVTQNLVSSLKWRKDLSVLPAFPEPLEITAQLPTAKQKTVLLGKAKAALFSRLAPHKQAFWLVQQWDFLKDYLGELHIHGGGIEEDLIREYIQEKRIGDRVKCWGKYPDGQAYVDLLGSYDLTLLPTIGAEGSPLVLLESMACGVPFVAYGVGGIPDYGTDNPDVIVVPPEPWLTQQARDYTATSLEGEAKAFLEGVKDMAEKLSLGKINQLRLQKFYFDGYSYTVLKKLWLSYLK
jgi:glycosyltransferase involved in cell wall biosynthesis